MRLSNCFCSMRLVVHCIEDARGRIIGQITSIRFGEGRLSSQNSFLVFFVIRVNCIFQ